METVAPFDASSKPEVPSPRRGFSAAGKLARNWWPELAATALLLVLLGIVVREIKANEGGRYVYTLDDGYFHLAVAKNLLRHGIWGTSALDGFSSGTSSLTWPLLIAAAFAVCGVHECTALVLNVLCAIGLLFCAGRIIRRATGSSFLTLISLSAVVVLTPLPAVISTGMEHCLQALCSLLFVDLAARLLTTDEQRLTSRGAQVGLCVSAMLMVMTRYEGLFLLAPVGLLLLCQRRWILALALGVLAVTPTVLFGAYAMSQGWYFLPNSLLLKGNTETPHTLAGLGQYVSKWYVAALAEPHMFVLLAAITAALLGSLQRRRTLWTYPALFLFITLVAMLEHLQLAGLNWFYRYEAYLVVLGFVGLSVALWSEELAGEVRYWRSPRSITHYGVLWLAAVLFGTPFWVRSAASLPRIVTASYNVYEQQYQMGHFVRRHYENKGVAINDVGAVSFFSDVHILDTVGLSDIQVLRARRTGTYNQETLARLARQRHVRLAIIYDIWTNIFGGPPPGWVRVGLWEAPNNTVLGSAVVSFYAPNAELMPGLIQQLQEFSPTLPRDIQQSGIYCGAQPLNETGTFPREGDAFWTDNWAQFCVYPPPGVPLGPAGAALQLTVQPISKGQTIDVFFNDALVDTHRFSPDETPHWTSFTVQVPWRAGVNVLRLVGHGTLVQPKGDGRKLLFMVVDPTKMMDDTGRIVPQANS